MTGTTLDNHQTVVIAMLSRDTTKNETVVSLMELVSAFTRKGFQMIPFVIDTCFIDQGRNVCFTFAKEKGADYLLFVDSDINLKTKAETVLDNMIGLDKDVVVGIYYTRLWPHMPTVYSLKDNNKLQPITNIPGKPFPVEISGCGFMLISKKVLHAFIDDVVAKEGQPFDFIPKAGEPFREDVSFCIRLKKLGFEIWADPTIELEHLTKTPITAKDRVTSEEVKRTNV